MQVWHYIAAILSGLIVCIPLTIRLVSVTREAVEKRRWNELVALAVSFMRDAETKLSDGATKKEWVMGMMRASAKTLDYTLSDADWQKISDMIDMLCDMAKDVNVSGSTNGAMGTYTSSTDSAGMEATTA